MTAKSSLYEGTLLLDMKKEFIDVDILLNLYVEENCKGLTLYIHKDLDVRSISGKNIQKYIVDDKISSWSPFITESKKLTIVFNKELVKGTFEKIFFKYSGKIGLLEKSHVNRISSSYTELGLYSPWFPLTESFAHAKFNIKIKTSEPTTVLASNVILNGNHWIINQDFESNDCSFIVSDKFSINKHSVIANDFNVNLYYVDNKHLDICSFLSDKISKLLNTFNSTFGEIEKGILSIVILPRERGGGYCRKNLIVLDNVKKNTNQDTKRYYLKYLAHELAHLWWNKANSSTYEDWLNESFAEYSCLMIIRDIFGVDEFNDTINKYKEISKNLPPIIGLNRSDENAFDVLYKKGAYLLYELEDEIGLCKFNKLLKSIHSEKIDTTSRFLEKLEVITDKATSDNMLLRLQS
ncbi:M1 family aminopeptidase [Clostridiaceae bacterium M8S5]|nr:M1 family aminopeptidase [Clostridiaceae bacterium M8S5]